MLKKPNVKSLKWFYLILISTIFFVGILVRVFIDISISKEALRRDTDQLAQKIKMGYEQAIYHVKDKYLLLSHHYMRHDKISNLMLKKDHKTLYKIIIKDYEKLQSLDPSLEGMHFLDTKNISLLRMHKPESFGDDLSNFRPIIKNVNKNKKLSYGFEVGRNIITYRITIPYIEESKKNHVGVLEYSINSNYFTKKIAKDLNLRSEIIVKQDFMKALIDKKHYASLGEYSIIESDYIFDKINKHIDLNKEYQVLNLKEKVYLIINNLNLKNYNDEAIAKSIVVKDITSMVNQANEKIFNSNIINIIVLILGLVTIYVIFNRYTFLIQKQYTKINTLNKYSKKLEHITEIDDLTRIYNKKFFNKYLSNYLEEKKMVLSSSLTSTILNL